MTMMQVLTKPTETEPEVLESEKEVRSEEKELFLEQIRQESGE